MDVVLELADEHFFSPYVYPRTWPEDDMVRQSLSLYAIGLVGGIVLYLVFAWLSYEFLFEKALLSHPRILDNQIRKELDVALRSIPLMVLFQVPFFVAEVRGHTKLFDRLDEHSWQYQLWTYFCFMMFNDCLIYWIHRGLHHPLVYKHIHKEHHRWIVPTPFASHAFHPVDGFLQGLPYSLFIFLMPLNKWVHLVSFILVNYWTINIHIGPPYANCMPSFLKAIVNGPAHHTDHHIYFNVNHGQYFTLWDRIGGTFRHPSVYDGKGPDQQVMKAKSL